MLNIGTGELLVIALVALIVLGPEKLPQAARQVGRFTAEARKIANGFRQEMQQAMDEVARSTEVDDDGGTRLSAPPTGAQPIDPHPVEPRPLQPPSPRAGAGANGANGAVNGSANGSAGGAADAAPAGSDDPARP